MQHHQNFFISHLKCLKWQIELRILVILVLLITLLVISPSTQIAIFFTFYQILQLLYILYRSLQISSFITVKQIPGWRSPAFAAHFRGRVILFWFEYNMSSCWKVLNLMVILSCYINAFTCIYFGYICSSKLSLNNLTLFPIILASSWIPRTLTLLDSDYMEDWDFEILFPWIGLLGSWIFGFLWRRFTTKHLSSVNKHHTYFLEH